MSKPNFPKELYAFAVCQCYVWPVVNYQSKTRCGRCGEGYEIFPGKEDAFEYFDQQVGGIPDPIGVIGWWELPFWTKDE